MRQPAPTVFPVFRSRSAATVLVLTHLGDREYSIADLARHAGTDTGSMTREVARLEQAGVLVSRRVGRTKLVSANREAPFYPALLDLVTITLGPAKVLAEELKDLDGIIQAEIFGSWAARAMGEAGPSPVDVDLLVIGRPDRDDLHDAVSRATNRLGREINTVVVSPQRWHDGDDAFLSELRGKPRVRVIDPPAE